MCSSDLLDDVIGQTTATQTAIPWIEEVIAVWNCMSLPVLEEMFIHAVWTNYKTESVDRVLNEVITALTKDEQSGAEGEAGSSCRRCDRLNFYRLVPIENFPEKAPLELRHDTIANQVIARTYMSGFGLSINPDKRRNAHLNYAMAFDDLTDTD